MFQTIPEPLTDMTVNMPSFATSTQTFAIFTDVQEAHPAIMCPITATLTPSAAWITLSADFKTITVIPTMLVVHSDAGTHLFTLTVNSANFSGSVPQEVYHFNIIVVNLC